MDDWTQKITELEDYFSKAHLPATVAVSDFMIIRDVPKYVESTIATLKEHNGNPHFKPQLDMLIRVRMMTE